MTSGDLVKKKKKSLLKNFLSHMIQLE